MPAVTKKAFYIFVIILLSVSVTLLFKINQKLTNVTIIEVQIKQVKEQPVVPPNRISI